jgi:hypothetical protein
MSTKTFGILMAAVTGAAAFVLNDVSVAMAAGIILVCVPAAFVVFYSLGELMPPVFDERQNAVHGGVNNSGRETGPTVTIAQKHQDDPTPTDSFLAQDED